MEPGIGYIMKHNAVINRKLHIMLRLELFIGYIVSTSLCYIAHMCLVVSLLSVLHVEEGHLPKTSVYEYFI